MCGPSEVAQPLWPVAAAAAGGAERHNARQVTTVCYIVRHFDSWLGRNIFSPVFSHVLAKLSPETHSWVQMDSMIAQEPV